MTCTTAVYDLSQILHYPIRVEVNTWDSRHPLRWVSYNDEGQIASGHFLEPPGLPLFTLEDDAGRRLCDALPESISAVAALMPAMDFELAQACATSEAARELANDAPLLFILAVDHARKQSWSLEAFNAFLAGKRSDILKAVGLPGSRSLVRLVRRLVLSPLLPWELEDIRAALQNPEYLGLMRHHPHLHVNHLRLLNRVRQPLWPGLLNLVDEHTSAAELSWLCRMIRDSLAMAGGNEQVRWTPSVGQPDGAPCPVITMDLDRFKMVNDTFGHEAGDTVLVEVYKCVRAELRQIDMLARWGGEEFVILLPHSELEQACRLAEAIRMRVEAHSFSVVGRLTASFGVAQIHRQDTLDSALKRSDEALYEAKASGRNRVNWRDVETEPLLQPPL